MLNKGEFLQPDWPAPSHVKACVTTRKLPLSSPEESESKKQSAYQAFNLADHVADDITTVRENRRTLKQTLSLSAEPYWLKQIHSKVVVDLDNYQLNIEADASFTTQANKACVVLTADCLPVLLCDRQGTELAAIHAGWRGLQQGIIKEAVNKFSCQMGSIMAYLGPAIGRDSYEVGQEVYDAFKVAGYENDKAFYPSRDNHWFMDIYELARQQLKCAGVQAIYGGEYCTFQEPQRFYSYRRDGEKTGRMASLIWLEK